MERILLLNSISMKVKSQFGFTMIEVLIAFIILATGLLGIVKLQFLSKKFNHQAAQRTLAVSYADAIIERIRSNPKALLNYTKSRVSDSESHRIESEPDCLHDVCSASEIAEYDLQDWYQLLNGKTQMLDSKSSEGLISPEACIDFFPESNRTRSGMLTVRVQWTGLDALSDAVTVANTNCNNVAANTDPYRRQLLVNTYVFDQTELAGESLNND